MDKNKVACLQNVGQAQEEGTFPGKMLQHRPAQAGQVVHAFHFQAQLRPHLSDEPPLPPKLKHRPQLLVRPGPPLQKHPVNMVTIAAQGVHRTMAGQLHDIAQGGQALLSLFQQIAHQHQDILPGGVSRLG